MDLFSIYYQFIILPPYIQFNLQTFLFVQFTSYWSCKLLHVFRLHVEIDLILISVLNSLEKNIFLAVFVCITLKAY